MPQRALIMYLYGYFIVLTCLDLSTWLVSIFFILPRYYTYIIGVSVVDTMVPFLLNIPQQL